MKGNIILIDDDPHILSFMKEHLSTNQYNVTAFVSPIEALKHLKTNLADLVVTDVKMNEFTGDDVLNHIKKNYPSTGVILMTGYGSIAHTVNAMRKGAFDYITKPFSGNEILSRINHFFKWKAGQKPTDANTSTSESENKNIYKHHSPNNLNREFNLIGESPKIKKLMNALPQIARNNAPVMIQGESGTGKEVYARLIQQYSDRSCEPYIRINCANLPSELVESTLFGHVKGAFTGAVSDKKGAFEEADGGTLLLDEITEIDINIQAKLLRVLQEGEFQPVGTQKVKKVDVRIISTTNRNVIESIREGNFRKDLYFRLNVFPIKMPSLNERMEDIPLLAKHFCEKYSKKYNTACKSISEELLNYLMLQSWNGNVRELENTLIRGILMSGDEDVVQLEHVIDNLFGLVEDEIMDNNALDIPLIPIHEMERQLIQKALEKTNGNQKAAAKILEISDRTIRNKLKNYMTA
ncbi:MAG TPA: sigma-54 dependent transcriptional regulator [Balneolales bacterium]|nr:sigma-54 dependent transcriptional regulator [Balneolales bacterium]